MAVLSSGPIENNPVNGVRPTQQLLIKLINTSSTDASSVLIQGYFLNGTRTLYVLELVNLAPNQVATRNYFANLNGYEFVFETMGAGADETQISLWGRNAAGQFVTAQRLVAEENLGAG
ncbi:hypothetical protein D3H55_22290 [Bacillus salacetis]|uniref:Uncharacterized protein n=1 Tax=Bacillus salacetis TaxID=2315464 RepID=A0A3A1QPX7_9BACI|nr:hypothetical protein [Bacillus salacetis]RIW28056.1 hypothetical protein D3H55_22290 [Bacillus salacetis]